MRAEGPEGEHISGAEGLYKKAEVQAAMAGYSTRALSHPKGPPSRIILTTEQLREQPLRVSSLPVRTLEADANADEIIRMALAHIGISPRAISTGLRLLRSANGLSGAALLNAVTGRRLDPRGGKGIRASRMGITANARKTLAGRLARHGIDSPTVQEALVLASKIASAPGLMAELCISDDPQYTTGYIASIKHGYVRIPEIKVSNAPGGRIFFITPDCEIDSIIYYLQKTPVLVSRIAPVNGISTLSALSSR